jgi:hypothetical protein
MNKMVADYADSFTLVIACLRMQVIRYTLSVGVGFGCVRGRKIRSHSHPHTHALD